MCDPAAGLHKDVHRCWCGARAECARCGYVSGRWFRFGGYVLVGRADGADVPVLRRERVPEGHTPQCIDFHYAHLDTPDQLLNVRESNAAPK